MRRRSANSSNCRTPSPFSSTSAIIDISAVMLLISISRYLQPHRLVRCNAGVTWVCKQRGDGCGVWGWGMRKKGSGVRFRGSGIEVGGESLEVAELKHHVRVDQLLPQQSSQHRAHRITRPETSASTLSPSFASNAFCLAPFFSPDPERHVSETRLRTRTFGERTWLGLLRLIRNKGCASDLIEQHQRHHPAVPSKAAKK